MQKDLTCGNVTKSMLRFAAPMVVGNLLQQVYNVTDTLIVGKYLGADALAAVGSSFTLIVFLTSVIIGLSMGSSVVLSMLFGAKKKNELQTGFFISFAFISAVALFINIGVLSFLSPLLDLLQVPPAIHELTRTYLQIIFYGLGFSFLYNYFASILRGIGDSVTPLSFLGIAALTNVILDILFILYFKKGVEGVAYATVVAQGVSAVSLAFYGYFKVPLLRIKRCNMRWQKGIAKEIVGYSLLTCAQQSIMNFGILMVQGLINSFGVTVMAGFAAAVKVDSFAYMPVQDFGNAFSNFIAQNYGAEKKERIRQGIVSAIKTVLAFCIVISLVVFLFAEEFMLIFVRPGEREVIAIGIQYLRIEGVCYIGIGCLFLFYGFYRGIGKPDISVWLTVISLGARVILAYLFAYIPFIGLVGIWWAIPIGWLLADITGVWYYKKYISSR